MASIVVIVVVVVRGGASAVIAITVTTAAVALSPSIVVSVVIVALSPSPALTGRASSSSIAASVRVSPDRFGWHRLGNAAHATSQIHSAVPLAGEA